MGITLKRTGTGSISKVTEIKGTDQKNIVAALSTIFGVLNSIIDAFNGRISLGDGTSYSVAGNLDAAEVEWMTPATPNTEFAVPHGLPRIPVRVEITRKDQYCDIRDSGTVWTANHVYLECNTASAFVLLRIS